MKNASNLLNIFIILILTQTITLSQNRNLNDRVKSRPQTETRENNKSDKRQGRISNIEIKTKQFNKKKKEISHDNIKRQSKPVQSYHPIIKPQPIYSEHPTEILIETIIEEETHEINKLTIEEVYPDFPLKFIDYQLSYLHTFKNKDKNELIDVYEFNFNISPITDSYFSQFGIQLLITNEYEYIQIFNEDENILYKDSIYNFISEIKLERTGYIKIKIGYYDKTNKEFYHALEIPDKTELLIYIKNEYEKVYIEE